MTHTLLANTALADAAVDSTLIEPISQGESLIFTFALIDQETPGWICTIFVREFTNSTVAISRVIPADDQFQNVWSDFLTSTETAALGVGTYRLIGLLTNASTDEERQIVRRFTVSKSWVD